MEMATYAVVEDGQVTNLVAWDGEADWRPDEGAAVLVTGACGIGWLYAGESFIAPVDDKPSI
ncbi:TPA: hypothetical protein L0122_001056 [Citrobacter freundii]|nr:hypothetical protein [Citrobacter freundii]